MVPERAWIGEDAFITFRTVDPFVNGNGLRWNPDERVQTYTHSLWMLARIPFYTASRDLTSAVVTVSLACTGGPYVALVWRPLRRPLLLLAGLFLPLACSGPLRTMISGPLFSRERLAEIARFDLGVYDAHVDAYVESRSQRDKGRSLHRSDEEMEE
jgi:hypothetical protein